MTNAATAKLLADKLGLDIDPVALAFADAAPAGVETTDTVVPSSCAFWRQAEQGVFFAPAAAHFNCPVGAMVMGFDLPKHVSDELMQLVGSMTQCGYVSADEPGHIPTNKQGAKGVVYGPLAEFPLEPDAVLVWLTPMQAMIWSEAAGAAEWGGKQPLTVLGRPGCAAIPKALGEGRTTLSLGCIGMRTFTGIAADRMLAVLPGEAIARMTQAVAGLSEVNDRMESFYKDRQASLAAH